MQLRSRASLDPYGIYGTRAARRFYRRKRRRKAQYLLLGIILILLLVALPTFWKWREQEAVSPEKTYSINSRVSAAPVWSVGPAPKLFVATHEGRLLQIENFEAEGLAPESRIRKSTLLETDFPLHEPLTVQGKLFVPGEDGVLTALDINSGKVLWRADFVEPLSARPVLFHLRRAGQTELQPVVVAGGDGGLLMALDADTGQPLWRTRLPAPVGNGLAAVESDGRARIFVPLLGSRLFPGGVWCLDGASSKVLWRTPEDDESEAAFQFSPPVPDLAGNRVYVANDLGAVLALNLTTGKSDPQRSIGWRTVPEPLKRKEAAQQILWRAMPLLIQPTDLKNSSQSAQPLLFVGGSDGGVRCISARDGIVRWRFAARAPIVSLLAARVSEGEYGVLVVSRDRRLHLLNARNGRVVQRFASRQERFVGAAVTEKQIFAATENGTIHRFALSNR